MPRPKAAPERDFQEVANEYAKGAIQNLREMIEALNHAEACDGTDDDGNPCAEGKGTEYESEYHDAESARERIQEDALSVEVRSDWHTVGDSNASEPSEYNILLATGGPAARIIGELSQGEPTSARFEYQDWFKPWTEADTDSADDAVMLKYASQFYYFE